MTGNLQFGGENYIVSGNNNVGKQVGARHPAGAADRVDRVWTEPLVFLNYRHPDELSAKALETELGRRLGHGVAFRDVNMRAGTEFPRELAARAAGCEVMLSVIGERWDPRLLNDPGDWVRREIAIALAGGNHVVPILIGTRPRLTGHTLPVDVRAIADLQAPHLRHGYDDGDVRRLVEHLIQSVEPLAAAAYRAR
jgi:hypothetical protein